jgi:23S rRNA (adenine2503-C2)-methyltransferase
LQNAGDLSKILKGFRLSKVNLITANPVKELGVELVGKNELENFKNYLLKNNINVTIRASRGEDIEAACGQLRLRYEKS